MVQATQKRFPEIRIRWLRFPHLQTAKLHKYIGKRPIANTVLGAKETGKSSLNEALTSPYKKIIDIFGCYDEQTETLTKDGWKYFSELTQLDDIATLTKDNYLEYVKPTKIHKYPYKGKMIAIKGQCDFLVTPNHKMLVIKKQQRCRDKRLFISAEELYHYAQTHSSHHLPFHIPKSANWNCSSLELIDLPMPEPQSHTKELCAKYEQFIASYRSIQQRRRNSKGMFDKENQHKSLSYYSRKLGIHKVTLAKWHDGTANPYRLYKVKPKQIPIKAFIPLLGWYLAEGSIQNNCGITFNLNPNNPTEIKEVADIVLQAGFKPHVHSHGKVTVWSRQLYDLFKPLGCANKKFIPEWIKQLPSTILKLLILTMVKGDGHTYRNKKGVLHIYTTVSKRLADDLQEIIIKSGYATSLFTRKQSTAYIKGRKIVSQIAYDITIYKEICPAINRSLLTRQYYDGYVYCVSVPPNETVLVRRNGKIAWSGNSRDNEGLAWLRSPLNKKVLFLKGKTVEIDCNCADAKNTSDFKIADIDEYDVIISCAAFYSSIREEWKSVAKLMDHLWYRQGWNEPVALVIREAANLLASRHILGDDQMQALNYTIYVLRELRHCGFTVNLDTIRWFGIDRDIRAVTDYSFIKATGTEGLPRDLRFIYRYFNAFKIQQMNPEQFIVLSRQGAIGTGTFDLPYWHKLERENLIRQFDIRIKYDREAAALAENANQKVSDLEHVRIIKIRIEKGVGIAKIGAEIQRSSRTVLSHIRTHNTSIEMIGTCDRCARAGYADIAAKTIDLSR